MNELAAEFEDVLQSYVKIASEFSRIIQVDDSEDPQVLIQSILDNRDCLTEIQQINKRMVSLYGVWEQNQHGLSESDSEKICNIIETVREQAHQLEKICGLKAQRVETRRSLLAQELQNIGKGSRYLKMIRPIQQNFPKFIDSAI